MKNFLIIFSILFLISISGCSKNSENHQEIFPTIMESSQVVNEITKDLDEIEPISLSDFDVSYQGILLNAETSLQELEKALNVKLTEEGDNVQYKAPSYRDDYPYQWNKLYYPSVENEELQIEYIFNTEDSTGRIVHIRMKSGHTSRGVQIGDTKEVIKEKYGNFGEDSEAMEGFMWYGIDYQTYSIGIIYDIHTDKVVEVRIDYDTNQAMEDMDISAFD